LSSGDEKIFILEIEPGLLLGIFKEVARAQVMA
jgi:hypothetical protein